MLHGMMFINFPENFAITLAEVNLYEIPRIFDKIVSQIFLSILFYDISLCGTITKHASLSLREME